MLLLAATEPADLAPAISGWDAVQAANGLSIAITGTLIVFTALAAISLFIGILPKVLTALGPWLPEIDSHHDAPASAAVMPDSDDRGKLAAAIASAVHRSRGG